MNDTVLILVIVALTIKAFLHLLDFKILDTFLDWSAISIIATLHVNGVL